MPCSTTYRFLITRSGVSARCRPTKKPQPPPKIGRPRPQLFFGQGNQPANADAQIDGQSAEKTPRCSPKTRPLSVQGLDASRAKNSARGSEIPNILHVALEIGPCTVTRSRISRRNYRPRRSFCPSITTIPVADSQAAAMTARAFSAWRVASTRIQAAIAVLDRAATTRSIASCRPPHQYQA